MKTGGRKSRGFESHPLRQLAVVAVAMMLAGCSFLPGRQLTYTFPATGAIEALPVVLTDRTGGVGALVEAPAGFKPLVDSGMTIVKNLPNAVVVHWIGGACDSQVAMEVTHTSGSTDIEVTTTRRPVACDAMGMTRAVTISFTGPVDADRIGVHFGN